MSFTLTQGFVNLQLKNSISQHLLQMIILKEMIKYTLIHRSVSMIMSCDDIEQEIKQIELDAKILINHIHTIIGAYSMICLLPYENMGFNMI
jgi:hypothetical protein